MDLGCDCTNQSCLLITNGNKLIKFSLSELFKYPNPNIFGISNQNLFVHTDLYLAGLSQENSFKSLKINDLENLLPSALDSNVYNLNNSKKSNIRLLEQPKKIIEDIWKNVILKEFRELRILYRDEKSAKQVLIERLKKINDWALIPVFYETDNKISETYLLPFSQLSKILSNNCSVNMIFLYKPLVENNFPQLKKNIFKDLDDLLEVLIVKFYLTDDVINFLIFHQNILNDLRLDSTNAICFLAFFNDAIHTNNLLYTISYSDDAIKSLIKSIKMFQNIFYDELTMLKGKSVYLIDITSSIKNNLLDTKILHESFLEMTEACSILIIEKQTKFSKLYSYLKLETISIESLYTKLFDWYMSHYSFDSINLKQTFHEHVDFLRKLKFDKNEYPRLFEHIKQLKFINIEGKYFSADECYTDSNKLFMKIYSDKVIPEYYRTTEWKSFLTELGLKCTFDSNECIKIAEKIRDNYLNNKINIHEVEELAMILFAEIKQLTRSILKEDFFKKFSQIKFIPSVFNFLKDNLCSKIYDPSRKNQLICLDGSYLGTEKNLCWVYLPILPDYCKSVAENENVNIITEINDQILLDNFLQIIKLLTEKKQNEKKNLLNNLSIDEIHVLEYNILNKYYSKFDQIFKLGKNSDFLLNYLNDKAIILTQLKSIKEYRFIKPSFFLRKLKKTNEIEGFMYKFPSKFLIYWDLFELLGAKSNVTIEACQTILQYYYDCYETDNESSQLNENDYKNILNILSLFIFNKIPLDQYSNSNISTVYFPNRLRELKSLSSLYYLDNEDYKSFIENYKDIQRICLFDIKDMFINRVLNDLDIYDNFENYIINICLKDKKFSYHLNWKLVFENMVYFKLNTTQKPKPISSLLIEKIDCEKDNEMFWSKYNKLKSDSIKKKLLDLVHLSRINLDSDFIRAATEECIDKISIYKINEISKYYVNSENGEVYKNNHEQLNLYCKKDKTKLDVYIRSDYEDEFEINLYLSNQLLDFINTYLTEHYQVDSQDIREYLSLFKAKKKRLKYYLINHFNNCE